MIIDLATSHFASEDKNVAPVKVVNFYATENPTSASQKSYISRPTVAGFSALPGSKTRGLYYQQGVFEDNFIAVCDNTLYKINDLGDATPLGNIPGVDECKFAATSFTFAILSDNIVYLYDGTTITTVVMPDDQLVSDLGSLNSYLILSVRDSNKFYWINPGDTTVDALSFASAEANADYLEGIKTTSDEVWLFGKNTTEVWAPSGDANAPFIRISGRIYNTGCVDNSSIAQGIVNTNPCLIWVSETREVVIAQGAIAKISNDYVEECLRKSTYFYGWCFRRNRNDFYVLTTDVITLVYDLSLNSWYRWNTYLSDTWDASKGVQKNDKVFVANLLQSSVISTLTDAAKDGTEDWLICEVTGLITNTDTRKPIICGIVEVAANVGYSSTYNFSPLVELRWSDDQGVNWSTYMQASLGLRGEAQTFPMFRSLGKITKPGRWFEFRFSNAENFRLDYVTME